MIAVPRGVCECWRVWALALVAAAMAVAVSLLAAGPVAAAAAVSHYDTAAYAYDAPALLSSQSATTTYARGSPSGPEVASRDNSVSLGRFGVAVEAAVGTRPAAGQTIYRVYGGDSAAGGASWTPVNPATVSNFRSAAGLPSGGASGATNTGRFVIEGTLNDPAAVVLQRSALPLDGMKGGLPEYIIPKWMESGSITSTRVSGVNPEF